jgi:hypothetical protein
MDLWRAGTNSRGGEGATPSPSCGERGIRVEGDLHLLRRPTQSPRRTTRRVRRADWASAAAAAGTVSPAAGAPAATAAEPARQRSAGPGCSQTPAVRARRWWRSAPRSACRLGRPDAIASAIQRVAAGEDRRVCSRFGQLALALPYPGGGLRDRQQIDVGERWPADGGSPRVAAAIYAKARVRTCPFHSGLGHGEDELPAHVTRLAQLVCARHLGERQDLGDLHAPPRPRPDRRSA